MPEYTPKDYWLVFYNTTCGIAWACVFGLASLSMATSFAQHGHSLTEALSNVYGAQDLPFVLMFAQVAALMEIVHAATKIVRSPVGVTTMQVMSRIVALYAVVLSKEAQSKWMVVLLDR